jgi:hypothetical protein
MDINPFDEVIVSEPRRIERSVSGLNQRPLEQLQAYFNLLPQGETPRASKLPTAQLVMSPEAGYGKSHLIGRLFKTLQGRATLVYLRPFADFNTCWKSILLKMVQEMEFPESAETDFCKPDELNQLEAFSHGILTNIVINGIKNGKIKVKDKDSEILGYRNTTLQQLRSKPKWIRKIEEKISQLASLMKSQLGQVGLSLSASPSSWLSVFFSYAFFPSGMDKRESCLDWMKGGSIDSGSADKIGIRGSDRIGPDASTAEGNEVCKRRIFDFCCLAGFYRPFVFCFDQTENYGIDPLMAATLGLVVQELADNGRNVFTVMTANQVPWNERLKPNWENAHIARLCSPVLELEGISISQGPELINNRLEGWGLKEQDIAFLSDGEWLKSLFHTPVLGVRHFLNECKKRFQILVEKPLPVVKVEQFYDECLNSIKTQPKRMVFDPDILYWLVHDVGILKDERIEKISSKKGYFSLRWVKGEQNIYFGFEGGSNWSRWRSINTEASNYHHSEKNFKVVFFRTPELKPIPGQWQIAPQLIAARQEYLHILVLDRDAMAELYAAYDLYAAAVEGNIPFSGDQVLTFVRNKLKNFWDQVLEPSPQRWVEAKVEEKHRPKPSKPEGQQHLITKIRDIVKKDKFLSVQDLMAKLSPQISEEELHKARACIAEIQVHSSPKMTVLQWRPKK